MRGKQDNRDSEALTSSYEDRCGSTMPTRSNSVEHSTKVRHIVECPLTMRASVEGWNATESQGEYLINKLRHAFDVEAVEYANTPRSQAATVTSNNSSDTEIETVHNGQGMYGDIPNLSTMETLDRPTISLGDLKKAVDLDNVLYGDMRNDMIVKSQNSTTTAASYRFEQPRPAWHFFHAITSNDVYNHAEDWGIDRSIYTRYSRSGFFSDCHVADSFFHGEYLDDRDCEDFAEYRAPLVICIISTSRDVRVNEVQKGIIPLAVSLLDRYIVKQKHRMSTLLSNTNLRIQAKYGHEQIKSEPQSSNVSPNGFSPYDSKFASNYDTKKAMLGVMPKHLQPFMGFQDQGLGEERQHVGDDGDYDMRNDDDAHSHYEDYDKIDSGSETGDSGLSIDFEIMYNFIAAACYFIADRYNGPTHTSVKLLLDKWAETSYQFTKTKRAALYISRYQAAAMSVIMAFMLKITFVLEYKFTVPFPCNMVEDLLLSTPDFNLSQNPSEHSMYQKLAAIMSRIAYVDDSFHRFKPSIVTLSIYHLIRKLAIHQKWVRDEDAWLLVDESDPEIRNCADLMANTFLQFVDTDLLDVLAQPVFLKQPREIIFNHLFDDWGDIELRKLVEVGNTLVML